jgi:hypothetical protein
MASSREPNYAFYHTSLALAGLWILLWLWMLSSGFSEAQSRGVEHATRLFMQNPLGQLVIKHGFD